MISLGFNDRTKVHGVGDGALWITEQGEKIAGSHFVHLIDLFHLCEYFSKAVTAWDEDIKEEVKRLKEMMEKGENIKVLEELKRHRLDHLVMKA